MKKIAKDVYQISLMPRNAINCYLIEDILVDAGIRSSAKRILKSIGDRNITAHALTHAHADHQGSSKEICEQLQIPLWCHEKEKTQAESGKVTLEYPSRENLIVKFQEKYWAGTGHPVAKTLKEGDQIGSFKVIETPGHSSGHISFFRESDGVLIVGDALVNMNLLTTITGLSLPPNLFTKDQKQNLKSVKKIASLKPQIIAFGHGPILKDDAKFQAFFKKKILK